MTHPRQRASDHKGQPITANKSLRSAADFQPEQYTEDLLAGYYDGVIGLDASAHITLINKTACQITGWTQTEALQQPLHRIFKFVDTLQAKTCREMISDIINNGQILGPIKNHQIQLRNGTILNIDFSISPLDEQTAILMFHEADHENSKQKNPLLYQFSHDSLTRLANRDTLQRAMHHLHNEFQQQGKAYSILLLDVDRFKLVNDNFGHQAGDQLLQLLAERMQHFIRSKDNIGRWGGEEFLCLLPDADHETACLIAQRLVQGIADQPFLLNQQKIHISASIGIASYPRDGDDPEQLLRVADNTLYHAKQNGRNRIHSTKQLTENIFSVGTQLENALNENRIIAVYQPIFDLMTGEQVAEEALARIQDENGELIPANDFIDAAVELQMVHRIDHQVIRTMVTRCYESFSQSKTSCPHFVNISADLLRHPQLVKDIIDFARSTCNEKCEQKQCEKKPFVIEITEQELLGEVDEVKKLLAPFIEFGMPLAIDDFGSGYSSLSYLADLPISYLKFDGSLIKRVAFEERARKIITGIQRMAESLELVTIAEHIENQQTLDALREIGVSWGQGYFSARPAE